MIEIESSPNRSSLDADGRREKIRLADVKGRFTRWRRWVFALLICVYAAVPALSWNGKPLILIDIVHRQFFLFGHSYNAQDAYLLFFVVTGGFFLLFFMTAMAGRIWCGWACPQTVFLEGVFRRIERWIEGDRSHQLLLARGPWSIRKIVLFVIKHGLYLALSLVVAHIFVGYFVSYRDLFHFMQSDPHEHWAAFVWMGAVTLVIYGDMAWFREQLCLIVCPYGRIQSALTDDDSLVIGYDAMRGEPRGKKGDPDRGHCINCFRCVDVCPTAIDIRNGLQLECIGCANCVDACDDVMTKIGQPIGLIRYDSLNRFAGRPGRFFRPRLYLYTIMLIIGALVASFFLLHRHTFEANVIRLPGAPFSVEEGTVRNQFMIHVVNKQTESDTFDIHVLSLEGMSVAIPFSSVTLNGMADVRIPVFVSLSAEAFHGDCEIPVVVTAQSSGERVQSLIRFLGPSR